MFEDHGFWGSGSDWALREEQGHWAGTTIRHRCTAWFYTDKRGGLPESGKDATVGQTWSKGAIPLALPGGGV